MIAQRLKSTWSFIYNRPWLLLSLLLTAGLVIRLALLPLRWINPDEGAHLLDARLLLQGQIPIADYGSRQPFYVLMLAFFFKLAGVSLTIGRLMPLLANLASAGLIFLLSRRLFTLGAAALATAIFLFLPYTYIWAPVVKTEPLAILLALVSFYLYLRALDKQPQVGLEFWLAGASAALAYYVRQSALYLPLTVLLFTVLYRGAERRFLWQALFIFALGYASVCIGIGLFYATQMPITKILFSQLNPLELVWNRVLHTMGLLPAQYRVVDGEGFRILDQAPGYTMQAWRESILFSLFIIWGAAAALGRRLNLHRGMFWQHLCGHPALMILLWPGILLPMYLFQSLNRGFYSQYFLEVLPPLLILCAWYLHEARFLMRRGPILVFVAALAVYYALFLVQRIFWSVQPPMLAYLAGAGLLAWLAAEWMGLPGTKRGRTAMHMGSLAVASAGYFLLDRVGLEPALNVFVFLGVFTVLAAWAFSRVAGVSGKKRCAVGVTVTLMALLISAAYSGLRIGPQYECVWPPATLHEITRLLKSGSRSGDTVLSGAGIWTLQAGLAPFMNVPHPTELLRKYREDFAVRFVQQPPCYIILDGYTEKKYARYWTFLQVQLEANYELVATVPGARYPVQVYRLLYEPADTESILARL